MGVRPASRLRRPPPRLWIERGSATRFTIINCPPGCNARKMAFNTGPGASAGSASSAKA